ncbi:hypothetical protein [Deinococcus pimensis]|uniref:hypothetical protein n=1 Tax=Deinococcus pimensis TaxID=309888 RepID=UPI0012F759E7|nr:hypothetical protein [Deinococcus pimensis]
MPRPSRRLPLTAALLLAASALFPVVASLLPASSVQRWAGVVDVTLAAAILVLAAVLDRVGRSNIDDAVIRAAYGFYRVFAVVPLALLALYFVVGMSVRWDVLLPGLAWRTWVLLTFLPSALAVSRMRRS